MTTTFTCDRCGELIWLIGQNSTQALQKIRQHVASHETEDD